MYIKVEFSTDSLFGYTDEEEYDVRASVKNFMEALEAVLYDEYPEAEIEVVETGSDRVSVDGMYDHDECPWIDQLGEKVWSSWDWLER
jgi:hypothetical protein